MDFSLRSIGWSLLLTLGLLGCSGDSDGPSGPAGPCTLLGCSDATIMTVTSPDGAWPDGAYDVELTLPGEKKAFCSIQMNELVRTNQASTIPDCSGDMQLAFRPTQDCSSPQGCVYLEKSHTVFVSTTVFSGQLHLTLRQRTALLQEGTVLLDQDITPSASVVQPNGPACGPTCHVAKVGLQVNTP